jgi:hypothetical protein
MAISNKTLIIIIIFSKKRKAKKKKKKRLVGQARPMWVCVTAVGQQTHTGLVTHAFTR